MNSCHFDRNADSRRLSTVKGEEDMPPLKAQFFHSSPLPIDDPLAALPQPDAKPASYSLIPFNSYDNNALEEAWLNLSNDEKKKANSKMDRIDAKVQVLAQRAARKATELTKRPSTTYRKMSSELQERRSKAIIDIGKKHAEKHAVEERNKGSNVIPVEGAPIVSTH